MNKFIPFIFILSALFFITCSDHVKQGTRITVTIEPQRYFAEQLVDTLFTITAMVPPGTSPESYDPTPQQMTQLSESKAYFQIGRIGFENVWLDKLKQNNPKTLFFDNSQGIDLLADPHIWTSPKEALVIVQNMYKALIEIDPENAGIYKVNLENLQKEINETAQTVDSLLSLPSSQKAFIIFHPALTYFARDYGLTQYTIEKDGKEPSPEQLKALIDAAKRENIKTVFIQQEFDQKNAEIIARETGCRLVAINPLSYHWREEIIRIAQALSDE
jgi:zinc transport system substrate-binding protein